MRGYIRPSDYRQLLRPASPVVAFILPWMLVLIGQQLALCQIIIPIYSTFYLVILGNMITSLLIAAAVQTYFPQQLTSASMNLQKLQISDGFKRTTYIFIGCYLSFQFFQMLYFQGFPLMWLLTSSTKSYADYGIHSLNGLLNAIYLLTTTLFYLIYLKEKKHLQIGILFLLLIIPILLVSRQLFMSVFLQMACCLLIYRPKAVRKIAIGFLALLILFVVIGNIRTGVQHLAEILGPKDYIPKYLYSLLWIYAYIVTPFNNINAAIDHIRPLDTPFYEITSLLPSIFRPDLSTGGETGFSLVHEEMNVSSFYLFPLLDFGQIYAFAFMAIFQLILFLSYRKALRANTWINIVEYAVLYMIMILSIFFNLFLFLPVIAQLIIIKIVRWQFSRRQGIPVIVNDRFER